MSGVCVAAPPAPELRAPAATAASLACRATANTTLALVCGRCGGVFDRPVRASCQFWLNLAAPEGYVALDPNEVPMTPTQRYAEFTAQIADSLALEVPRCEALGGARAVGRGGEWRGRSRPAWPAYIHTGVPVCLGPRAVCGLPGCNVAGASVSASTGEPAWSVQPTEAGVSSRVARGGQFDALVSIKRRLPQT